MIRIEISKNKKFHQLKNLEHHQKIKEKNLLLKTIKEKTIKLELKIQQVLQI